MTWLLAAAILLFAGFAIESSLLVYAGYVLLALLGVTRWLAHAWIEGLSATRTVSAGGDHEGLALEIGGCFVVEVKVSNEAALPVPWVLVEDNLPRGAIDPRYPRLAVKGRRLAVAMLSGKGELTVRYEVECLGRGFHQVGPAVLESGDLFGLHRRFRVLAPPRFVLVYPRIVPLSGYDIASRRPIGDVRMTYRLFEDPTRIAGVREYQAGDPLGRIHWKVSARTGTLHSKVHEPSTLSGVTVLLDLHKDSFHQRGEPFRSELAVTVAVSLAYAVYLMGQQIGLVTNARDAAQRIKTEGWDTAPCSRHDARAEAAKADEVERLEPLVVETGRGPEKIHQIRETLARAELATGLTFAGLVTETAHRLPRDATALAVLSEVSVETALALGNLRRRGMAVAAILVQMDEDGLERAYGRLVAEGIRDLRHCPGEEALPDLCSNSVNRIAPYDFA